MASKFPTIPNPEGFELIGDINTKYIRLISAEIARSSRMTNEDMQRFKNEPALEALANYMDVLGICKLHNRHVEAWRSIFAAAGLPMPAFIDAFIHLYVTKDDRFTVRQEVVKWMDKDGAWNKALMPVVYLKGYSECIS